MFSEKAETAPEQDDNVNSVVKSFDEPRSLTFRDEEVAFILAIMEGVNGDDDHEKQMIENIKNTLNSSLATQQNEKR